jgi:hypothetical protein
MSIFSKKRCDLWSAKSVNEEPSCQKAESADFPEKNSCKLRNLSPKTRKGWLPKKLESKLKKFELNSTNLDLKSKNTHSDCTKKPDPSISSVLKVKNKTIRAFLSLDQVGISFL